MVCAVVLIISTCILGFKGNINKIMKDLNRGSWIFFLFFEVNQSNQQLDVLQKELHRGYQNRQVDENKLSHQNVEKQQDPVCTTKECVVAGELRL